MNVGAGPTNAMENAMAVVQAAASISKDAEEPQATGTTGGGGVGEPMQGSSTAEETIVVHTDSSIELSRRRACAANGELTEDVRRYGCPANGTWSPSVLAGSLTGSIADGPGPF